MPVRTYVRSQVLIEFKKELAADAVKKKDRRRTYPKVDERELRRV